MRGDIDEPDQSVLDGLRKACDDDARPAGDDDHVDGVPARYVAAPTSTEQVADVLAVAAQHDLAVVARGSGSKLGWGLPPTRAELIVDTTGLRGPVDHAAGDLVCVAGAGTRTSDLQELLASEGQQLALDSPFPDATLGGVVATSSSGPRRLLHGTMRDMLIGVTFVRADGMIARSGGRVVKNVAGYDLGKLLTGSFGTLGVVTAVVLRLHPLPAARRVVSLRASDASAPAVAAAAVTGAQLVPSAVELAQNGSRPGTTTVLLEGVASGVDGRAAAAAQLLAPYGEVNVAREPPAGFTDLPWHPGGTGLKVTCSMSGVGVVLDAARRLASELDVELVVRGSAAGVLHAGLPPSTEPASVARVVGDLRSTAAAHDGAVVVLTAPSAVRAAVDVWGPVPGLDLMRRLKAEMDPDHRLAPGRFVGGI